MMMDIPVSRLNNRLALQLPVELPLGLVFVVGRIENLKTPGQEGNGVGGNTPIACFDLVEKRHRITCKLSHRAAPETKLSQGAKVRAGGHLVFDCHRASYYLLARDIEIVSDSEPSSNVFDKIVINGEGSSTLLGRQALTPALADIKRRAESTNLAEAKLPYWVQRLAPPEIKAELAQTAPSTVSTAESTVPPLTADESILTMLSQAMDSEEEVELTSEMAAHFSPKTGTLHPRNFPPTEPTQTAVTHTRAAQQNVILPLILLAFTVILLIVLLTFLL